MELIKDYDLKIRYQPGKANMVADASSRKSVSLRSVEVLTSKPELRLELMELGIEFWQPELQGWLNVLEISSSLVDEIKVK